MGIRETIGKSVWNKLSWSDRAYIAWIYMREGMAAAVLAITVRCLRIRLIPLWR